MARSKNPAGASSLSAVAAWLSIAAAAAHTLPISYLTVVPDADYLHVELMLNPFELNFFSEVDQNRNGRLDPAELAGADETITTRIADCLKVRVGGKPVAPETAGVIPDLDSHHLAFRAHYPVDARRASVEIESALATVTSGSHVTQVTYTHAGRRQLAQLDTHSGRVTFEPFEQAAAAPRPQVARRGASVSFAGVLLLMALPAMAILLVAIWLIRKARRAPAV